MVITVVCVGVVQASPNQIIYMASMRNSLMSALWSMNVFEVMALGAGSALVGIIFAHLDGVLVHMIGMLVVKMSIVKVICMPLMFNRHMSAARAVLMWVILMLFAIAHGNAFLVFSFIRCQKRLSAKDGLDLIFAQAFIEGFTQ